MIAYFDASALAKRYVRETGSDRVLELLAEAAPTTCRLTEVEVASALARRCREGAVDPAERDRALAELNRDLQALFVVELTPEVVAAARSLLLRHAIRTADAVQLGSCLELQRRLHRPVTFVAFDHALNAVATAEGLTVVDSPPVG